jgi:hypothetical protein
LITIETELDSTIITIIDPNTGAELEVIAAAEGYYLRQYAEDLGGYDLITITPMMLKLLIKSLDMTDGVYQVE